MSTSTSVPRSRRTRLALVAAGTVAAMLLSAPVALAGKPSGGGGGGKGGPKGGAGGTATVSVVLLDSTDGAAHWNQRVTFKVTTTNTQPYVNLRCYQGGTLVSTGTEGFFSGSLDDGVFGLSSPAWTGGDADCVADVKTNTGAVIGTTSFHVFA